MKYQHLAYLGIAALRFAGPVSATPIKRNEDDSAVCSPDVEDIQYVTVTPGVTPVSTPSVAPTVTPSETPAFPTEAPIHPPSDFTPTIPVIAPSASSASAEATPTAPASQGTSGNIKPLSNADNGQSLTNANGDNSGIATFYGGNVQGGACSFSGYTIPAGLYGTALGNPRWDNAAQCGACVAVTGPNGKTVNAMIVDKCPECDANHLDLFQNAFTELADISKGIIDITWSYVPCGITTPLILKNKEGTSAHWFSMQVVNANEAVTKFEVSTDGGNTWQGTTRSDYNFFENTSGFGTQTVDVRVTGISGKVVTVQNVGVVGGTTFTASGNV
ncbi:RlpA-like double-psi beta-barrel-protein domain-containing protein-containing protein [Aspergillus coremiiformis]|uniref:RlpA-like double-psi beta-barrel-protein domain-containing protein-containing protein n=1 Tax=Aspergillus coremiiformis TaxID=138285 RepID=A0A5N6Z1V8_9EURO|nr:RlpA-like double-psi beta-barrel-protein domain-containing protein-containing protein [Aspergillus coremiiformis]